MFTRKKKASIAKTLVSKRVREVGPALLLRCSATSDIIELVTTETPEAQSERKPICARVRVRVRFRVRVRVRVREG